MWRYSPSTGSPRHAINGASRISVTGGRMRYSTHTWTAVFATLLLVTAPSPAASAQTNGAAALRVGAARVDVAPAQGALPTALWQTVTARIEKELGIPRANVLLTATHTHSGGGQRGQDYEQKIVESVRVARQRLTPA